VMLFALLPLSSSFHSWAEALAIARFFLHSLRSLFESTTSA
jgi:hypothetical protein